MRGLEDEYRGRVRFDVRSVQSPGVEDEVRALPFGGTNHGLVTFAADGTVAGVLPGHQFGRAEIEAKVKDLLSSGASTPR